MAKATKIREVTGANGKTKFQAQVWHKGVFYASATFDLRPLAVAFKEKSLEAAIQGTLKPAAERKATKIANDLLGNPMTYWADQYVATNGKDHGQSRKAEYRIVGRLLAKRSLRDFDGRAGAHFIERLAQEWRHVRLRGSGEAMEPITDNTLRLRLTALARLLRFAKAKLPEGATFRPPAMDDLFEYTLPRAHGAPRKQEISDSEYVQLLNEVGQNSAFGQLLRVIDETGARLGEVLYANGSDVHVYTQAGQVVGGHLNLKKHKTSAHVDERDVPLSLFAAQVLHARKLAFGNGRLFSELGSSDKVCKVFDGLCCALGINKVQTKDLRRTFINRNKYCVAHMDMVAVVGNSSLLDKANVTSSEKAVLSAVGHTTIDTTGGYARPDLQQLARLFSETSRWPRTAAQLQLNTASAEAVDVEAVRVLQQRLADTMEQLARVGAVMHASMPVQHPIQSPSTDLQPVARRETVKADAFTLENIGPVPLWPLGRHGTLQAGRPHPTVNTAPSPTDPATAASTGGQPARRMPLEPLVAVPAVAS